MLSLRNFSSKLQSEKGFLFFNDTALPSETYAVAANTSMNLRKANRQ